MFVWPHGLDVDAEGNVWVTDVVISDSEFVAVDREGNLYGGKPGTRKLQKYVRVRP